MHFAVTDVSGLYVVKIMGEPIGELVVSVDWRILLIGHLIDDSRSANR